MFKAYILIGIKIIKLHTWNVTKYWSVVPCTVCLTSVKPKISNIQISGTIVFDLTTRKSARV
jgi:hypothetical protein